MFPGATAGQADAIAGGGGVSDWIILTAVSAVFALGLVALWAIYASILVLLTEWLWRRMRPDWRREFLRWRLQHRADLHRPVDESEPRP